jgi:DNA polymerase-3 subunit beta
MKFQIATEELVRALARVQGIVERRSTNPIIANVLLDASAGSVEVTATDTQVGLVARYPAEVDEPGRITVAARPLFEIVRNMPVDQLQVNLDGELLKVVGGSSSFDLRVLPADEFPPVPAFAGDASFRISSVDLAQLIELTSFAISTDETRTGLNGAHVELQGEMLRMVATDGHRLSLADRPVEDGSELPNLLVARKGLFELKRVLEDFDGAIEARREGSQLLFRWEKTTFVTRLLEGQFPDYQQVIPKEHQRRVSVGRSEFLSAIKRVMVLAPEKSHAIRFEIGQQGLVLESRHSELGAARIPVDAEVEGDELTLGFNARYFRDLLSALSAETIHVEIGDSLSPTLLRIPDDDRVKFVVMPMRLE